MRTTVFVALGVCVAMYLLASLGPCAQPVPVVVTPAPTVAPDSASAAKIDSLETLVDSLYTVTRSESPQIARSRPTRTLAPDNPPKRYATLSDSLLALAADSLFRARVTRPAE